MCNAFESYLIEAIRVFLHKMNWEESDDYDFDADLIDASENLAQRKVARTDDSICYAVLRDRQRSNVDLCC